MRGLEITEGGDVAFCHSLNGVSGTNTSGKRALQAHATQTQLKWRRQAGRFRGQGSHRMLHRSRVARCKASPATVNLPELTCQSGVQGGQRTENFRGLRPEPTGGRIMRTRIPKLIAEINTIIADHSETDSEEEEEAIELLKRARHKLGLARVKLQEADLKKHRLAAGQ